jgi:hypothetical protein
MEERYQLGNNNDTNDLPHNHITIDEFTDFVAGWTEGFASPIWRYFGKLSASGCDERELGRKFAVWSAMIERKTGTNKFRLVAGVERRVNQRFDVHFFLGGVNSREDFDTTWTSQWLELGGTDARVRQFTWEDVREYLKNLKPRPPFEHVRLIAKLRHTPRR